MVSIIVGAVTYTAALIGCYDGDTCTIKLHNAPELVSEITLRFEGFDTPEIKGQCWTEKVKAKAAQAATYSYMLAGAELYSDGERGKYGRLLVRAPGLQDMLIRGGLAVPYEGGKRGKWCK